MYIRWINFHQIPGAFTRDTGGGEGERGATAGADNLNQDHDQDDAGLNEERIKWSRSHSMKWMTMYE